ncbi:hypothetical protein CCP3SC15_730006 [Gammaproteobacteria bacterium]
MTPANITPIRGGLYTGPADEEFTFDQKLPMKHTVQEAIKQLQARGIQFDVLNNDAQIKIGHVNYYPTRGSVSIDGQRKFKRTGLNFLIEVLQAEGLYRPKTSAKS